jgi:hypothetical protein
MESHERRFNTRLPAPTNQPISSNAPSFVVRVVTPWGTKPALEFSKPTQDAAARRSYILARREEPAHARRRRWRTVSWLLASLAALQVLDMVSTLLLLSIGGMELNPIASWSLKQGVPVFVALKIGIALVLLAFIPLVQREKRDVRAATWACASCDVVFGIAVALNFLQFVIFA